MAYSVAHYTGDGSNRYFAVPFPFIDRSHVSVDVDGTPAVFLWVNDGLIDVISTPANGASVDIRRNSSRGAALVDFQDGAVLTEADLELANKQSLYVAQEAFDAADESTQSAQIEAWSLAAQAAAAAAAVSASDAQSYATAAGVHAANASASAATAVAAAGSVTGKMDKGADNTCTANFRATVDANQTYDLEANTVAASFAVYPGSIVGGVSGKEWSPYRTKATTAGVVGSIHAAQFVSLTADDTSTGGTLYGSDIEIGSLDLTPNVDVFGHRVRLRGNGGTSYFNNASIFRAEITDSLNVSSGAVGFDVYNGTASTMFRGFRVSGAALSAINRVFAVESSIDVLGACFQWTKSATSSGDFLALLDTTPALVWRVSNAGDIAFEKTGQRIYADFNNATRGNRLLFQNKGTNLPTDVGTIPSGTGTQASFTAYNASTPTNYAAMEVGVSGASVYLNSFKAGTGTLLPLAIQMSGVDAFRITTGGVSEAINSMRAIGKTVATSLAGTEIYYDSTVGSGTGFVQAYDRTGAAFKALNVAGSTVSLWAAATEALRVNSNASMDALATFRATGSTSPSSGAGLEMLYSGGIGYLQGYDRTGAAWRPVAVRGSTVELFGTGVMGLRVDANANCLLGVNSGLVTSATGGFAAMPYMSGIPSGTPSAVGACSIVVDVSNNRLYVWNGSAWKYAALV